MFTLVRGASVSIASLVSLTLVQAVSAQSQNQAASATSNASAEKTSASSNANKACSAADAAKLNIANGVSVSDVCNTVVSAWTNRTQVPNPPRLYKLTEQNTAFGDQLSSSMKIVKGTTKVVVDIHLPQAVTVDDLKAAKAPDYTESELGVWLDRIGDHGGVIEQKDTEALAFAPLVFEWIGKPVIQFLVNTFFKRDPFSASKKVDAVVRTVGSGPNAGSIRRICFVPIGHGKDKNACPL